MLSATQEGISKTGIRGVAAPAAVLIAVDGDPLTDITMLERS
ncbi:MAG: hypothetical protein WCA81_10395 [Rhizomicrobium sp.]|jgi:hypothetical protein